MLQSFFPICLVLRDPRPLGDTVSLRCLHWNQTNGQVGHWGQTYSESACSWMLVSSYCSNKRKGWAGKKGWEGNVKREEESRQVWGETELNFSRKDKKKKKGDERKKGEWWTENRENTGWERTQDEYKEKKRLKMETWRLKWKKEYWGKSNKKEEGDTKRDSSKDHTVRMESIWAALPPSFDPSVSVSTVINGSASCHGNSREGE